ncbi:MAG: hypothetical protein ACRDS0_39275, partial [Pseudonocardiaceae bacterium]
QIYLSDFYSGCTATRAPKSSLIVPGGLPVTARVEGNALTVLHAAYAIKAARAAAPGGESEAAGRLECRWQRDQLPEAIRELVLDDQRLRNEICWSVFDS